MLGVLNENKKGEHGGYLIADRMLVVINNIPLNCSLQCSHRVNKTSSLLCGVAHLASYNRLLSI